MRNFLQGGKHRSQGGFFLVATMIQVFEICDADGNRYPSEADAEAAGLDRAEYGAMVCEFSE